MDKNDAIRRCSDLLREMGFTFVEARARVQCTHYAMQDQAATRHCPVPMSGGDIYGWLMDISMRREFGGVGR